MFKSAFRRQEGNEYLSGSLADSMALSSRLSASSHRGRGRALPLWFHKEWMHPDCPVHKWYTEQTQSSTRFTSIEYRRELRAPFYHEFLLVHLDDGATCRLERLGEGSRADAIRRIGCTAHDIIQWFPPNGYENDTYSKERTALIMNIDYLESFDLKDVLAICYSIRRGKKSSAYTLQRFNCYFLCATVITILARRVSRWERMITQETWARMVDETTNKLRTMECKDAYEYLGFGVCSLVNPDNSRAREPILVPLQKGLNTSGRQSLDQEMSLTLWHKDIQSATYHGLGAYVQDAAEIALNFTNSSQQSIGALLRQVSGSHMETTSEDHKHWQSMALHYFKIWVNFIRNSYVIYIPWAGLPANHLLNFLLPEHGTIKLIKDSRALWESMVGPCSLLASTKMTMRASVVLSNFCDIIFMERVLRRKAVYNDIKCLDVENRRRAQIAAMYGVARSSLCDKDDHLFGALKAWHDPEDWKFCLQECVCREFRSKVEEIASSAGELAIYIPDGEVGADWWEEQNTEGHPQSTYTGGIPPATHRSINDSPTPIHVIDINMPDHQPTRRISAAKFQEYIRQRICAHARRVGGSAPILKEYAPLVQSDIEEAMSEIWVNLPSGFGGNLPADLDAARPHTYYATSSPARGTDPTIGPNGITRCLLIS